MKKLTLVLALCIMSGPAFATCKSDAADKKLAGAALKSFMTKCERDATTTCETNSKDKKLAGAAKTSHMKKCVGDAVGHLDASPRIVHVHVDQAWSRRIGV